MSALRAMMKQHGNHGFTPRQVAWRLGVSVQELREMEGGDRFPNFETWDRMCKAVLVAADLRDRRMTSVYARRLA